MRVSPDGNWIVCVRESHAGDVTNEVVALRADRPSEPHALFAGADFVGQPRFVGEGRLRWIAWDHPNMPWNDTSLYEARFDSDTGQIEAPVRLASGQSFMQPIGELVISDRSNWWNVWRFGEGDPQPIFPSDSEMGYPAWTFGDRDYVVAPDGRLAWAVGGTVVVDGVGTQTAAVGFEHWTIDGSSVTVIARFSDRDASIVRFDLDDPTALQTVVPGRALP
jgi:hypothetical protein